MRRLVLVIGDEPDLEIRFRQQFRKELRSRCFNMDFAKVAIARIGNCANVNLILSDVNLPGLGGFDLLKRTQNMRPDVPVIIAYGGRDGSQRPRKRRRRIPGQTDRVSTTLNRDFFSLGAI